MNRGGALVALKRPQDALEACDEVIRRFGESETPALLERVATALSNKGAVLVALHRPQDALEASDEVIRRFGESDSPVLSVEVKEALLRRADIEIKNRQYEKAVETAARVINRRHKGSPEQQLRGHVIRAKALLAGGDRSAFEHAVEAVIALLPELDSISREGIMALIGLQRRPRTAAHARAHPDVAVGAPSVAVDDGAGTGGLDMSPEWRARSMKLLRTSSRGCSTSSSRSSPHDLDQSSTSPSTSWHAEYETTSRVGAQKKGHGPGILSTSLAHLMLLKRSGRSLSGLSD